MIVNGPGESGVRPRGRPRSLTTEQIVEAALKLTDESSLDDVSMRSLANELGVPVMTIYNYVASKEALNELVVDHALRPVEVLPQRRIMGGADARASTRRPQSDASTPGTLVQPPWQQQSEAMRLAEGAMSILHAGGFAPDEASTAFATLFTFMLGQIELDVLSDSMGGEATFEGVTSAADRSRDELFEIGLDTVIAGINLNVGGRSIQGRRGTRGK